MSESLLSLVVSQIKANQSEELEKFLGQSTSVAVIISSSSVPHTLLDLTDAKRLYHFCRYYSSTSEKVGESDKRSAALIRKAMVREYPNLHADFILLTGDKLKNASGMFCSQSAIESYGTGIIKGIIDFQFELKSSEALELAEYIRWIGSVRPASDVLSDGRKVSAKPSIAISSPCLSRFIGVSNSTELSKRVLGFVHEASKSIWLTAPSVIKKGFIEELHKIVIDRGLSVRCMIGDSDSAKELAIKYPEWEILHCKGLNVSSLLIDAEDQPVAIIGTINWMSGTQDNILALALPLEVDDSRIERITETWKSVSPHCKRVLA